MWSLPDINAMNARAAASVASLKRSAKSKRKPKCEHWDCKARATVSHLVYDIFSDDAKSVLHLCDKHDGYSGNPMEGYFTCEHCQRVLVENYTWELYRVTLDDATVCLKCAAELYFANAANWIEPKAVSSVVLHPRGEALFDPETGILNVAGCRHVLGVKQPLPAGIAFHDNAEFDNTSGHQISGEDLLEVIQKLNQPFCPVLDAAYQFAVSIGIYVRSPAVGLKEAA